MTAIPSNAARMVAELTEIRIHRRTAVDAKRLGAPSIEASGAGREERPKRRIGKERGMMGSTA